MNRMFPQDKIGACSNIIVLRKDIIYVYIYSEEFSVSISEKQVGRTIVQNNYLNMNSIMKLIQPQELKSAIWLYPEVLCKSHEGFLVDTKRIL